MFTTSARAVHRTVGVAAGMLMLGAGLGACGDTGTTTAPQAPTTAVQNTDAQPTADAPAPTGTPADTCSGLTGADAVERWAGDVPPTVENYPWNPAAAETDGYDPCADLSWIILPIEGGTASSPYQIMLFHDGDYLGTATSDAYGFHPTVSRVDDATISVTWHWPREGEPNAGPTGESTAQFAWDAPSGSVAMTGEVPPV